MKRRPLVMILFILGTILFIPLSLLAHEAAHCAPAWRAGESCTIHTDPTFRHGPSDPVLGIGSPMWSDTQSSHVFDAGHRFLPAATALLFLVLEVVWAVQVFRWFPVSPGPVHLSHPMQRRQPV